jgi:SprT-like protein
MLFYFNSLDMYFYKEWSYKMDLYEVERFCRIFLKDSYNLELLIPVEINSRLSTTLGFFIYDKKSRDPIKLEFSKKFLTNGSTLDKIKVIKHECIHYALFIQNKPHKDGDEYFESELLKHGSIPTDTVIFKIEKNVRVYSCECSEHIFLQTIMPRICNNCNERLSYVGKRKELV